MPNDEVALQLDEKTNAAPSNDPKPKQPGAMNDKELDQYLKKDRHIHSTALGRLASAQIAISNSLGYLRTTRVAGVNAAKTEVSGFKRVPPKNDSLLFDLAMAGLMVASGSFGAALATHLAPSIKRILTKTGWTHASPEELVPFTTLPSDTVLAFIGEGIEQTVQLAGAKLKDQMGSGEEPRGAPRATESLAEFFRISEEVIAEQVDTKAEQTAGWKTIRAFYPFFEVQPGADLTDAQETKLQEIERVAGEIRKTAATAAKIQQDASVAKWVDYVRVTDQAGGDLTSRKQNGRPVDGLIDLTLSAAQAAPQQPVRVTDVNFNGVKKAVVKRFIDRPLGALPLSFRATAFFGPSKGHDQFVSVVREPSNEIKFSDTPSENGSWFAGKVGGRGRARDEDKQRGAQMLVDELARMSLMQHLQGAAFLGDATQMVDNDSED